MKAETKRRIILGFAVFIIIVVVISSTIGREILQGKEPSLYSFAIIHFLGYLFFIIMPVEALFPYYLAYGVNPVVIFLLGLGTALLAQLIDYSIGHLLSEKVIDNIIGRKKHKKYSKMINKYGNMTILVFNTLPLSSPIVLLIAGMLRLKLRRVFMYSAIGLSIKYSVIVYFFTVL